MRKMSLKISTIIVISAAILMFNNILSNENSNGWFTTGQDAYILLSGIDFNNTGGALLFNHPMNMATDGTRLLLADTRNNRVLIWNTLPDGNVEPNLVLGQKNFTTNNPGTDLSSLNWPVGVSTADERVVIADTYNDRILIWNTFPTSNAQAADLSIELDNPEDPKERIEWPWAVWTDGSKLIVTSTVGGTALIYNTFPTYNNQKSDLYLKANNPYDGTDRFGTPRTIGTDGENYLVIGDHNAMGETVMSGSFFWNSFPTTDNQSYDFFLANPKDQNQMMWGGVKTSDGKFVTVASPGIAIWNSVPTLVTDPDLFVGKYSGPCDSTGYYFNAGDGSGLAVTSSGKLFVSLYNSNKVVVFNNFPTSSTQCPDFAIGAPDIDTNTLDTNYIITNGIPATNGSSLIVSSDFDRKLYVWKSIPSESRTHPDTVYNLDFAPWDNALYNDIFVIAGKQMVQIWNKGLPLYGNTADITFDGKIGSTQFQNIKGVALDDKYLYIADDNADKLYIWNALPDSNSSPLFSLDLSEIGRLSSDGNYLAVVSQGGNEILIYSVKNLSSSSLPLAEISKISNLPGLNSINLVQGVLIADNHLFIADTNYSRVFCWESIEDAINGNFPEVVLGKENYSNIEPGIGVDSLFWPVGLSFYRNKLWVAEFKFSGRLVCFKYQADDPFIEINPTFGYFGEADVGSNSTKTFTISNTGTENLEIEAITIAITNSSEFITQNDSCSGQTLAPSGTCTFDVIFSPSSEGKKDANLTISSNDPDTPNLSVPLNGTGTSAVTAPTVTTGSATSVTSSSATLNGTVNPNSASTEYYSEYGTSTSYGSTTGTKAAGSGTSDVSVSAEITGLSASTTYYFRIVATNSAGASQGSNQTFTTSASGGGEDSGGENGGGGCAIATACYGTAMAEEVKALCAFRDQHLLKSPTGLALVSFYCKYSPKVADFIRDKKSLKAIIRTGLKPVIWIIRKSDKGLLNP